MPLFNRLIVRACLFAVLLAPLNACLKIEPAPIMKKMEARLAAMPPPKEPFIDGIVYRKTLFSDVKLDLYLPYNHESHSSLRHPVYIYVHGGSWLFGHRKQVRFGAQLIEQLRTAGVAVISIDYRKLNEAGFHRMVDDTLHSLDWLADNAERYHLNPTQLVLHGSSAGGHLAQMMTFTQQRAELDIQLLISDFGPSDLIAMRNRHTAKHRNFLTLFPEFRLRPVSPVKHVRKNLPPTLLIHGELDTVVPLQQSLSLQQALEKNGNEVELLVIEGANHGLLNIAMVERQKLQQKRIDHILQALGLMDTKP